MSGDPFSSKSEGGSTCLRGAARVGARELLRISEGARGRQSSSEQDLLAYTPKTHPRRPQVQDTTGAKLELLC